MPRVVVRTAVAAQPGEQDAGGPEAVAELRVGQAAVQAHGTRRDAVGERAQRPLVARVERLAHEHELRVGRAVAAVQGERPQDVVVTLVRREPADAEHGGRAGRPLRWRRRPEPGRVEQDRDHGRAARPGVAQLGGVVLRDAGGEVDAASELRQLRPPHGAVDGHRGLVVPQVARGGDVVGDEQLAVGRVEQRAQLGRVGRVVEQQHVAGRRAEAAQRPDAAVEAGGEVGRPVLAAPAPLPEQAPVRARLSGDGVDGAGAGEELVDDHAPGR